MRGLIPANIKCCFSNSNNNILYSNNIFPTQSYLSGHEINLVTFKSSIKKNYQYSARFYSLEIRGPGYFTLYPYRVTAVGDVYHVDYLYDFDQIMSFDKTFYAYQNWQSDTLKVRNENTK